MVAVLGRLAAEKGGGEPAVPCFNSQAGMRDLAKGLSIQIVELEICRAAATWSSGGRS